MSVFRIRLGILGIRACRFEGLGPARAPGFSVETANIQVRLMRNAFSKTTC